MTTLFRSRVPKPAPSRHHDLQRAFCINCARTVPGPAAFCLWCGALLSTRGHTSVDSSESSAAGGEPDAIFVMTLLERRDRSRRFDLSNGSSLGAVAFHGTGPTRVGSHPDDDIFLNHVTVSNHHAEFFGCAASCAVRDLHSLNGTFVNGVRVDEAVLSSGDEIQIGTFRLLYSVLPPRGRLRLVPAVRAGAP
jgi:hypothetical protein